MFQKVEAYYSNATIQTGGKGLMNHLRKSANIVE